MEAEIAHDRPYIQLVDEDLVTANDKAWTGFYPDLNAYCKCYYTSPTRPDDALNRTARKDGRR